MYTVYYTNNFLKTSLLILLLLFQCHRECLNQLSNANILPDKRCYLTFLFLKTVLVFLKTDL